MAQVNLLTGEAIKEMKPMIAEAKLKGLPVTRKNINSMIRTATHTVCQRHKRLDLYMTIVHKLYASTQGIADDDTGLSQS